jgi:hypothetical protein
MVELTLNHVSSAAVGAVGTPVLFGICQGGEEEIVANGKIGVAVCEESIRVPFQVGNSASVRDGRPSRAFGRSSGVALLFSQTPCRSGWPSSVRGGFHDVDFDVCNRIPVALDV